MPESVKRGACPGGADDGKDGRIWNSSLGLVACDFSLSVSRTKVAPGFPAVLSRNGSCNDYSLSVAGNFQLH
jgi:hypothetical protein